MLNFRIQFLAKAKYVSLAYLKPLKYQEMYIKFMENFGFQIYCSNGKTLSDVFPMTRDSLFELLVHDSEYQLRLERPKNDPSAWKLHNDDDGGDDDDDDQGDGDYDNDDDGIASLKILFLKIHSQLKFRDLWLLTN